MYKNYYGLAEEPFSITPDPRYLFMTSRHREALNHLLFGIRRRMGFICLTGEVGAGKTTLCRALLRELDKPNKTNGDEARTFHTALILNPSLSQTQLLRAVVAELGIKSKCRDRLGCLSILNEHLLKINSLGHDTVLIIDEAQDMPCENLEMARLLSNLETESQKLLQIVLVGQPELRKRLRKPSLRQLAQRITVRYHLGPMTQEETAQYVRHRLKVAGLPHIDGQAVLQVDDDALREVYRFSRGTPRVINALADKMLLAGYVYRTGKIDRRIVRIAANELREAA